LLRRSVARAPSAHRREAPRQDNPPIEPVNKSDHSEGRPPVDTFLAPRVLRFSRTSASPPHPLLLYPGGGTTDGVELAGDLPVPHPSTPPVFGLGLRTPIPPRLLLYPGGGTTDGVELAGDLPVPHPSTPPVFGLGLRTPIPPRLERPERTVPQACWSEPSKVCSAISALTGKRPPSPHRGNSPEGSRRFPCKYISGLTAVSIATRPAL